MGSEQNLGHQMRTIAVSQRVASIGPHRELRDTLDQRLTYWLRKCGYLTVPIPTLIDVDEMDGFDFLKIWIEQVKPNGLLLSGGDDIGSDPNRDQLEFALLGIAQTRRMPVLGICRGLQIIATWAGASITPVKNHAGVRHQLVGERSSEVNSYHNFGIEHIPEELEVIARAEDGVIEAIRHRELAWEGWMWHPEREKHLDDEDRLRFRQMMG